VEDAAAGIAYVQSERGLAAGPRRDDAVSASLLQGDGVRNRAASSRRWYSSGGIPEANPSPRVSTGTSTRLPAGFASNHSKIEPARLGLVILGAVVDDASSNADEGQDSSPAAPEQEHGFGDLQSYVPQDILDVSFPVSVRGYERRAVDAHIERVNRVIAELKVRGSPPAAVRHALEQAEEKVQGLLQAAREAAEEITASAQREAEERTTRAKAEAAELIVNTSTEADRVKAESDELSANARTEADDTVAKAKSEADELLASAKAEAETTLAHAQAEADERRQRFQEELAALREEAEARTREIEADIDAVWKERGELLEDIRRMAGGLVDVATAAAARIQRREPAGPEEAMVESEVEDEPEPREVATDESARAMPAVESHDGGVDEPREEVAAKTASRPDT
jgi:DivIVA domain-containing protein